MTETAKPQGAPLLNGAQTIRSIRDTGYKSTDYAIAELIDNSVQAKAHNVLVVVVEETIAGRRRLTTRADEIWVIDDGEGMDAKLANTALSIGGSHRYDDRSGIGRFGMGLPQASVSQCKRTDLWTWQNGGPANAVHTYLDLDEIQKSAGAASLRVPWPTEPGELLYPDLPDWLGRAVNSELRTTFRAGQEAVRSGTAIRWSTLDRTRWVRSSTIRKHAEYLLGRIYRRFLTGAGGRRCAIKFAIVNREELEREDSLLRFDRIRPNDPTYVSTPEDDNLAFWDRQNPDWHENSDAPKTVREPAEPLFETYWGPQALQVRDVEGTEYPVTVVATMARPQARPANIRNVGTDTHQGKHTRRNRGISVLRSDREIVLETTTVYEATDRWWSVEVHFPPSLDEIFGVTNNKQEVPYFSQALRLATQEDAPSLEEALESGEFTEDHPIAEIYDVAAKIVAIISKIRGEQKQVRKRRLDNQNRGDRKKSSVPAVSAAVKRERSQTSPTPGERQYSEILASTGEGAAQEEAIRDFETSAARDGVTEDETRVLVDQYREGMNVQVIEQTQSHAAAFFWPEEYGDLETLNINVSHEGSRYLLDPLRLSDERIQALSDNEAKQLLARSVDALVYLLLAWSRMELEHRQTERATAIQYVRESWGRMLSEYVGSEPFRLATEDIDDLFDLDEQEERDE